MLSLSPIDGMIPLDPISPQTTQAVTTTHLSDASFVSVVTWEQAYDLHSVLLYRLAMEMTASSAAADAAVEQAFLRLYVHPFGLTSNPTQVRTRLVRELHGACAEAVSPVSSPPVGAPIGRALLKLLRGVPGVTRPAQVVGE